ncbi:MAG: hypothetical protein ACK4GC_02210, partial [Paracoccaceae bacterium]
MTNAADEDKQDADTQKPLAEIIVGLISAAAVAALVIYLAVQVWTGDDTAPDLVARVQSTAPVAGKTLMMVKVVNRGDKTAADVTVRAAIPGDDGREISFDYVASGSSQIGAFLFYRPDVSADDVTLTIYGLVEPWGTQIPPCDA